MAKVAYGPNVVDMRNLCGEVVYSRGRDGAYARRYLGKHIPLPSPSVAIGSSQTSWKFANAIWYGTLTDQQRAAWTALAKDHPTARAITGKLPLCGYNMFRRINMPSCFWGSGPKLDAPGDIDVNCTLAVSINTISATPQSMVITVTAGTPLRANEYINIWSTCPLSAGRSNLHKWYRAIDQWDAPGTRDEQSNWIGYSITFIPIWTWPTPGQRIGIKAQAYNDNNGALGAPVYASALCTLNPPGPFRPNFIPGLQLWLQADAITGLASGDPVSLWPDSGPLLNHAVQADPNMQPTYLTNQINGKPTVQYNGTSDVMKSLYNLPGGDTPYAEFIILTSTPSTAVQYLLTWGTTGAPLAQNTLLLNWLAYPPTELLRNGSFENFLQLPIPTTINTPAIYVATYDRVTRTLWLNGTEIGEDSPPAYNITSTQAILGGLEAPGYSANGQIAEAIAYTQALTTLQRQKVEGYLAWKWGQVALLPAGHPYKTSPP